MANLVKKVATHDLLAPTNNHYSNYAKWMEMYFGAADNISKVSLNKNSHNAEIFSLKETYNSQGSNNYLTRLNIDILLNKGVENKRSRAKVNSYNALVASRQNRASDAPKYELLKSFTGIKHTRPPRRYGLVQRNPKVLFRANTSPIDSLIKKAQVINNLPYNWDEEGGLAIDPETLNNATDFLKKHVEFILNQYGVEIQLPEINPCKDGSIDLEWHTQLAKLLINIRKDNDGSYTAYYYGDKHKNKNQIKGSTPVIELSEHLAVWMKYLV